MKKTILKLSIIIILTASAAALAVFLFVRKFDISGFNLNPWQITAVVAAAVLGGFINFFLHMLFHETGHLVFGKLNGFKFYRLTVWFFSIEKRADKRGVKLGFASSKYGGVSQMMPVSEKNLYKKFGIYVLGGLIGSFIISAAFLLALLLVSFQSLPAVYIYAALLTGFPLSVYFLTLNSMPVSVGGLSNDGGLIKGLLKKDSETKIYINVLTIQSKSYAGLSPSEIEEKLYFDIPVVADNCVSKILLLNLQYNYYLDKLDFENANNIMSQLTRLRRYTPDIYLEQILADKFFNTVFYLKDPAAGEIIYSKIKEAIDSDENISALRIRMAYELFILKDKELSKKTGEAALKIKDSYPLRGLAKMEEKIINILTDTKIE